MTTKCRDCTSCKILLNNETYCTHHDKNINLSDESCTDFISQKFIIIESGDTLVKNTETGMYYDDLVTVQKLNSLDNQLKEWHKAFLKSGEKRQLQILEVMGTYAQKYNRDSPEFQLICEIASELGVTISLFGAKDDED